MEDYARYLAAEAKSDISAFHQFMLRYNEKDNHLHLFFEGEEDSFVYMTEIRRVSSNQTPNIYDCGGKKKVIAVRDRVVSKGYDYRNCMFFVDRDFDDFLGTQVSFKYNTYCTDGYSVENDLVCSSATDIILTELVRISRADPLFEYAGRTICASITQFNDEIRSLTAWILAAKEEGIVLNLQNTNSLNGIIGIKGGRPVLSKAGFNKFKRCVMVTDQLPEFNNVLKWMRFLQNTDPKLWVRGKYLAWFFHKIVVLVLDEVSNSRKSSGGKGLRLPNSLRAGALCELLGGRLHPAPSLRAFYQSVFKVS